MGKPVAPDDDGAAFAVNSGQGAPAYSAKMLQMFANQQNAGQEPQQPQPGALRQAFDNRMRQTATSRRGIKGASPLQASIEASMANQNQNNGEEAPTATISGKGGSETITSKPPQANDPVSKMYDMAKGKLSPQQDAEFQAMRQSGTHPAQLANKLDEWIKPQKNTDREDMKDFEGWYNKKYPAPDKETTELASLTHHPLPERKMPADAYKEYQTEQQSIQQAMHPEQQSQQQPEANMMEKMKGNALPRPPQAGAKLTPDVANRFLSAVGGNKEKAREIAKLNGWSL